MICFIACFVLSLAEMNAQFQLIIHVPSFHLFPIFIRFVVLELT